MSWILDHVPPWVWLIAGLGGFGVLWFYFSPIIIAIWNLTPKPIRIALGAVGALIAAVMWGRYRGAKDEREAQKKREAGAVDTRSKINEDVKKSSDADIDKRLSRWMRDD